MNNTPATLKHHSAIAARLLLWAWLSVLTVLIALNYRATADLAEREQVDASLRQVQVLEEQLTELSGHIRTLQTRPSPVSKADVQELRQDLETRLGQLEQVQENHAPAHALQALRDEFEQVKSHQTVPRPAPPATNRIARAKAITARKAPFPFRVLGLELRAEQRMVSIAPASGESSPAHIQVVLPGETVGQWRLDAIEGYTAIFSHAGQQQRLTIPVRSAP
ncbi:hypothetical protein [Klebsiella pneumoniae]|uniref:hypothetical protein n=1 Tax=Klebsiella pneumoniae TaxID=573 RepID=UPI001ABC457F|nr:hypothetical protein [Klebsiella pneumoniae]MBO3721257.1 hypothetical protein [Klebsiella pneumoniae]HCM5830621.1 hypothetical protein [Klebsiella pneumoniae]